MEVPITIDMYFRKEVTLLCLIGEANILLNFPSLLLKKLQRKTLRSFPKVFPFCQSTYWKKNCCTFLTVTQNALLRPYYTAKRTRGIAENMTMFWERAKIAGDNLTSNIHQSSPQKVSHFVLLNMEKVFTRGQP